jgi:Chaperone of endosialidase
MSESICRPAIGYTERLPRQSQALSAICSTRQPDYCDSLHMKTTILPLKDSMNRSHVRAFVLIVLACFALSPEARATCQEGCGGSLLSNTFLGDDALINNTTGLNNTATGFWALLSNTSGFDNTAIGARALQLNTTGFNNTAIGFEALQLNTTGRVNTAVGLAALFNNTTGFNNTAIGNLALINNSTGKDNIALGDEAGGNLTIGDHNIDIGNRGIVADANTIRIGRQGLQTATYIAAISGATVPTGVPVIVDTTGHLGTTTSSERYKEAIKPMDKASEAILALKPVIFRYKKDLDPEGIPQFGLVAEDVEKVNPALVARDEQGKPYTVRYEAVNAMLLNEFLKEHKVFLKEQRKVEELEAKLAEQEKDFTARLKEQAAKIQQVSNELELSKLAPKQVVTNR